MCGIFSLYDSEENFSDAEIKKNANKCQIRGPDKTKFLKINNNLTMIFHRLRINDLSLEGDQPMSHPEDEDIILICNGEIYNVNKLCEDYRFNPKSKSDCEVILHLYKKFGIEKTVDVLDGVFAFVIVDLKKNKLFVARDPFGIRSLFLGYNTYNNTFGISSELKSLDQLLEKVEPFQPSHIMEIDLTKLKKDIKYDFGNYKYYSSIMGNKNNLDIFGYKELKIFKDLEKTKTEYLLPWFLHRYNYEKRFLDNYIGTPLSDKKYEKYITEIIYHYLNNAVKKRLLSNRPIGCLLSGGFDSSIITALVAQHFESGKLKTFSIGLEGSEDLKYARKVAEHLGTDHHEVVVTEKEMLEAIPNTIYTTETYDTTTVRASTPMLLLSKYIKKNTDVTVVFSGEGSDEASGSYMYFHNAPNDIEFQKESERLISDLYMFDVLRCDKSTAGAGLEVRVPFLDHDFMNCYMRVLPEFKNPKKYGIEKYLLRKAFDGYNLLPKEVLWRTKEGMSDGVSSQKRGWFEIIQEFVDSELEKEEYSDYKFENYKHNPPKIKESLYYRILFDKFFNKRDSILDYYWLPKWSGNVTDPSARVLNVYQEKIDK
jgi:asparagine synthase (glutamine-hydrolysing)